MARVQFTAEAKKDTGFAQFEKLKLKKEESARIWVYDNPVLKYVHTLRKPKMADGVPVMIQKNRRDGSTYEDHDMEFMGTPICLGDESTLDDKGSDPDRCIICAAAKENSYYADAPKRRYAMNVLKIRMQPGSTSKIATPFSAENMVWSFTDQRFNKIVDAQLEWEDQGGLRMHDLILGPCENEGFQKYDIRVAPDAKVAEKPEYGQYAKAVIESSKYDEKVLNQACGSDKEERWIQQDLNIIKEAWAEVSGANSEAKADSIDDVLNNIEETSSGWAEETTTAPSADLDDILGGETSFGGAPESAAPEVGDFDDLLNDSAPAEESSEEEVPEKEASAEKKADEPMSVDDILAGL